MLLMARRSDQNHPLAPTYFGAAIQL